MRAEMSPVLRAFHEPAVICLCRGNRPVISSCCRGLSFVRVYLAGARCYFSGRNTSIYSFSSPSSSFFFLSFSGMQMTIFGRRGGEERTRRETRKFATPEPRKSAGDDDQSEKPTKWEMGLRFRLGGVRPIPAPEVSPVSPEPNTQRFGTKREWLVPTRLLVFGVGRGGPKRVCRIIPSQAREQLALPVLDRTMGM